MKVIQMDLENLKTLEPMAACIGYFDGMHLGHMQLVERTLKQAASKKLKSACITFDPDPWCVIKGMQNITHLTSMEQRIQIGEQCNLDYWIIFSFTSQLATQSNEAFEKMLADIQVKTLVCGFDYAYGYHGSGNVLTLQKQHYFDVEVVEAVLESNEKISSTRIEKLILEGQVKRAADLLGRPYSLIGSVEGGNEVGRTMGYPTANLKFKHLYVMPAIGVYIGFAFVEGKHYRCMVNIGHNPTLNYKENLSVETFLIDFNRKIYGCEMELILIEKIRDEIKFNTREELIHQLDQDVKKAQLL